MNAKDFCQQIMTGDIHRVSPVRGPP
jgi:hypothetical protein